MRFIKKNHDLYQNNISKGIYFINSVKLMPLDMNATR